MADQVDASAVGDDKNSPSRPTRAPANHQHVLHGQDREALLRKQPLVRPVLQPLYLNIMLAGESGQGKSSFIYNTAARLHVPMAALNVPDAKGTLLSDFERDPECLRTQLPDIELPEANRVLKVTFQDTPGYGDGMDLRHHLRLLSQWLLEQRERDYGVAQGNTELSRSSLGLLPHSATLCLFFIQPHRVKQVDLVYLSALSRLVPVVPVIAKTDCHTLAELEEHRQSIMRAMKEHRDSAGRPHPIASFTFSADALTRLCITDPDQRDRLRVFSVICSRDMVDLGAEGGDDGGDAAPVWVPVRDYAWGSANGAEREHSDTILLQRLITEDVWTLMEESKGRYLDFCRRYKAAEYDVRRLVDEAMAPYETSLEAASDAARRQQDKKREERLTACVVLLSLAVLLSYLRPGVSVWVPYVVAPPLLVLLAWGKLRNWAMRGAVLSATLLEIIMECAFPNPARKATELLSTKAAPGSVSARAPLHSGLGKGR